jgi:hypothetical protein
MSTKISKGELSSRGDNWCRYRTPFTKDEFPVCKAGINYHQFMPMSPDMPCLGKTESARARCTRYSARTAEELAERERRIQERFDNICKARNAIVKNISETGRRADHIECPVCGGVIGYRQASNGHIHAGCSNKECVRWME